jgi:hypothetical protein
MHSLAPENSLTDAHPRNRYLISTLALLIIPTLLVLASMWLKEARGPYWLGSNSDPSYAYLFNGLGLLHLYSPTHIDHPGTPLQILCALVIGIRQIFLGKGFLVEDVLRNPEAYLGLSRAVLLCFYYGALLAVGWVTLLLTQNLAGALLIQATPFLSISAVWETTDVRPELLQLTLVMILVGLLLCGLRNPSSRGMKYLSASCGLLVGILTATKITALPLVVLPLLILPSNQNRLQYVLMAIGGCLISVLPILSQAPRFMEWIAQLAMHTGRWGSGTIGLIDAGQYFVFLMSLLLREVVFGGILIGNVLILIGFRSKKRAFSDSCFEVAHLYKGLLALTVVEIFQLLLVAKHPSGHYLTPSLGLLGFNLFVWLELFGAVTDQSLRHRFYALLAIVVVGALAYEGIMVRNIHDVFSHYRYDQMAIHRQARENYGTFRIIQYYRCSSIEYALQFGDKYAGRRFKKQLHRMYPQAYFYDIWGKRYGRFGSPLSLEQILAGAEGVIYQGSPFSGRRRKHIPQGVVLEQLCPDKIEVLYRIRGLLNSTSSPGRIE